MTIYILIDAVLVAAVSVFALKGMKMGLVLSVASVLTLIVAMFGARLITNSFSHYAAGIFEPMVSAWVENKAGLEFEAIALPEFSLSDSLQSIGMSEKLADDVAGRVRAQIATAGESIGQALSGALALTVARCFTYTVSFLALALLLNVAARLLDTVANFPILGIFNKLGGLAGGAAAGAVVLYIAIGSINFLGFIGPQTYNRTYLLKLFVTFMEGWV